MKKAKLVTIFFFLILSGCKDILVEEPKDVLSPDQFYENNQQIISGVNGVYTNASSLTGSGNNLLFYSHGGTDLSFPTAGRFKPWGDYQLSASNLGNARDKWRDLFRAVGDANQFISRVQSAESESISDEMRTRSIGEAKVLRAYFYNYLTNIFGDVPLWLDELNVDEVSDLGQTDVQEVRQQMITDLTSSEVQSLPSTYSGSDQGRITTWTAKMLLSKYYLWTENWQEVKNTTADIIQNSPHRLLNNYEGIFGIENEYNDEIIWEFSFTQDINPTNDCAKYSPRGVDEPAVPGYTYGFALITVAPEFLDTFNPNDERLSMYNWNGANGVQTNNSYAVKFIDWDAPRGVCGVNTLIYRLADAYLMYAEAENELNGPTSDAYSKINTIRQRAGLSNLSGLSQEEFRDAIMDERKWELAFEHHRRWDLNRWGELVNAVQTMEVSNPQGVQNVESHHTLFPIPTQEIQLNSSLSQNPGY